MSRRSSKFLPALLVLLAAGIGSAAWFFLQDSPSAAADVGTVPELASAGAGRGASLDSIPSSSASAESDDRGAAPAKAATESERRAQATLAEAELSDAIWVDGRVEFPDGTPGGEVVEVVALGRKFKNRELHRVKVEPDGRFRVAFAPGTKSGRLDIDALHLFLDKPQPVRWSDGVLVKAIVLEPFLGGALRGQLRLGPCARSCCSSGSTRRPRTGSCPRARARTPGRAAGAT